MPQLVLTNEPAFKLLAPGGSVLTDVPLPDGVAMVSPSIRPSFSLYKKRTYINGMFTKNLVWTENFDLRIAGIEAVAEQPVAVFGPGTGIHAASVVYVITYAEVAGNGDVVAESDASDPSDEIPIVDNQSTVVTAGHVTHPNPRVNMKFVYRSDNGGLYRKVGSLALASTVFADNTPTLALGAALRLDHGVPPYTKVNEVYHDRIWYALDPLFPDRIWFSELNQPEAVGTLNYLETRDGEAITCIKRVGDQLLVFAEQCAYVIQGYTESDFRISKISPTVGCISHHSAVNIDETLWFASEMGIYTYDGSFRFMMQDLQQYWLASYKDDPARYQNSIAIDDRYYNVYKLLIPWPEGEDFDEDTDVCFYYVGAYLPTYRGEQPYWSFDFRNRNDRTMGLLAPAGANRFDQYVGSCDGYLRKDNDPTDGDDDGAPLGKTCVLQTGALLMGDPGGDEETGGKTLAELWAYVQSEDADWSIEMTGGDEDVVHHITPDSVEIHWKSTVDASALTANGYVYTAKSVHFFKPERVSGRAFCIKISAVSPIMFKYRGIGGMYTPGAATRPPKSSV